MCASRQWASQRQILPDDTWFNMAQPRGQTINKCFYYNDVIMSVMAYQITSLTIVYSTIYSGADQRKHQSSASLAFVRGIHRWPENSPHKGPVTRIMFPFDDIIMADAKRWPQRDRVRAETISLRTQVGSAVFPVATSVREGQAAPRSVVADGGATAIFHPIVHERDGAFPISNGSLDWNLNNSGGKCAAQEAQDNKKM